MIAQIVLMLCGLGVAVAASEWAVRRIRDLAAAFGVPAFLVGVVIVALGTDLPEIANSIAAHLEGEGDVNVGDSTGSVLAQYTIVLALVPLFSRTLPINRREVAIVGGATIPGLAFMILAAGDGWLSRGEGTVLALIWASAVVVIIRTLPGSSPEALPKRAERADAAWQIVQALIALVLVGTGATVGVRALISLADSAGVPEFALAYFGAALATSAPELVLVLTALRRHAVGIALGDVVGASFVDSSLSLGAGPLIAPAAITTSAARAGAGVALAATVAVVALLVVRGRHDWKSSLVLVGLYAGAYVVVIEAA